MVAMREPFRGRTTGYDTAIGSPLLGDLGVEPTAPFATRMAGLSGGRMDEAHCCSVTLIVSGADLDPDLVSAALGMAPDRSWQRGEPKSFVRNDGSIRVFDNAHDEGGWKSFMPPSQNSWPIQDQLESWLVRLSGLENVIRLFDERGWETELDGFVATREILHLPPGLMLELVGLGLSLALTFSPDRTVGGTGPD
jgi:hypothetical protein